MFNTCKCNKVPYTCGTLIPSQLTLNEIDLAIPVEGPIGLLVDAQSSMNGRRFRAVSCEIIAIREEENVQIRKT
jgi:hypothetical protein